MQGITLFIPVYNESALLKQNIRRLKQYMQKLHIPYQILIVSNGSTDDTDQIGKNLTGVHFHAIPKRGVGRALRFAIPYVQYAHIVSLDIDLSIDLGFIEECVLLIKTGFDLIVGSKQNHQKRAWYRLLLSYGFIYLVNSLLHLPYHDYSIAAKCWPRSCLHEHREFIDDGSSYVVSLLALSHGQYRSKEVDVLCVDERASKFNLMHEVVYRFYRLLSFTLEMKSRKFYK